MLYEVITDGALKPLCGRGRWPLHKHRIGTWRPHRSPYHLPILRAGENPPYGTERNAQSTDYLSHIARMGQNCRTDPEA